MQSPGELNGPTFPPAAGGDPTSIVVLLHGYGSNGQDLIGLVPYWRDALPYTLFVAPNAPEVCPGAPGGYQWWSLTSRSDADRASGVRGPVAAVNGFIDRLLDSYSLPPSKLALVGFSQGTMLALHVGPRRDPSLAGILGYSGMLVDGESLAGELRSTPPVLLVHGDADAMVPVSSTREAEAALRPLGFEVRTHVSPGLGHSIDEAGIELGGQFLVDILG